MLPDNGNGTGWKVTPLPFQRCIARPQKRPTSLLKMARKSVVKTTTQFAFLQRVLVAESLHRGAGRLINRLMPKLLTEKV